MTAADRQDGVERCGIALHPAGHTLSPILHAEAYRELGLQARYEVHDIPAHDFERDVRALFAAGVRQLSVSIPHKEAALTLADHASPAARAIGAANTLTRGADGLRADNTDWLGFTRSLEPLGPWHGSRASVLGAGGAARGIVYALRELGCSVTLIARNGPRAARLAEELGARVGTLDEPYDLLVNATPVGMQPAIADTPAEQDRLRPGSVVFDSVYRPLETRLLREARARGCRGQDGLGMLVHQAAEQVFLWSGKRPSAERMQRAALAALA